MYVEAIQSHILICLIDFYVRSDFYSFLMAKVLLLWQQVRVLRQSEKLPDVTLEADGKLFPKSIFWPHEYQNSMSDAPDVVMWL